MSIKANKIVTFSKTISSSDKTISLPSNTISFVPDKMIIKQISYSVDDDVSTDAIGVYNVKSSLTGNDIIATFSPIPVVCNNTYSLFSYHNNLVLNTEILLTNASNSVSLHVENSSNTTMGKVSITVEFQKL